MPILTICPYCSKTINVDRVAKITCPECGEQFGFTELHRKKLLIDPRVEARELAAAKDYFTNAEFMVAAEHFKKALDANQNSYSARYFVLLCDLYLHEEDNAFDVTAAVVNMLRSSLEVMARSNAPVSDKLKFITAMLAEIKIIITRRLTTREELFKADIGEFRKISIADLSRLLDLFKIDRELIMSFAPEVTAVLTEIAECAIKTCYRAVQTVVVGEELYSPSDEDYKQLLSLCNDYCFFAHSLNPDFDGSLFSPDFSQNNMLNEKVLSRFNKFDENNKLLAKKSLIGDMAEYESIIAECKTALRFTYLNCYRSMCTRQSKQHAHLFFDGLKLVYRLLLPRVAMNAAKKVEIRNAKFADIVDWCDTLTRFLVDSYELDGKTADTLHGYYEKLYEIVSQYYIPDVEKICNALGKLKNASKDELGVYIKVLFDCACCCAPALKKYVDYSVGKDKTREKLVKACKLATENFLLISHMTIDELEQSNFYRPILQISSAILEEDEE